MAPKPSLEGLGLDPGADTQLALLNLDFGKLALRVLAPGTAISADLCKISVSLNIIQMCCG